MRRTVRWLLAFAFAFALFSALSCGALAQNFYGEEPGGEDTLTAEEFMRPESFVGWDFENVWSLENGVRPILRSVPEAIGAEPGM